MKNKDLVNEMMKYYKGPHSTISRLQFLENGHYNWFKKDYSIYTWL